MALRRVAHIEQPNAEQIVGTEVRRTVVTVNDE